LDLFGAPFMAHFGMLRSTRVHVLNFEFCLLMVVLFIYCLLGLLSCLHI
jgi:hypothetical protein